MKRYARAIVLGLAAVVCGQVAAAPGSAASPRDENLVLWYRQPAKQWVEALPIGNGRLGGMIHGGVEAERVELNDNTLYSGEPGMRDLPSLDVAKDLDRVVQ